MDHESPRDVLLMACGLELEDVKLVLIVEMDPEVTGRNKLSPMVNVSSMVTIRSATYMGSAVKPVDKARLGVAQYVGVVGQCLVCCSLVHDQLHRLDAAIEVRVEIPGNGRIGNLIVLRLALV